MYACGLRISEAANHEVTAIDGKSGLVRVVGKGNKERQVPLPEPVLIELRRAIHVGAMDPPQGYRCGARFTPPPVKRVLRVPSNAGGCACIKKAASATRCRLITISNPI
jgi:integrase